MNTNNKQNRWAEVRALFEEVMELSAEDQDALLDSTSATDLDLANEVRKILESEKRQPFDKFTRNFLDSALRPPDEPHEKLIGKRLGPYNLVSILGRGGAGCVYLGERADKRVSHHVAIKVVGQTDSRLSARFNAERQILATLNHSNIARLLDAGDSEQNYSYIVMEYIDGEVIDKYCENKQLPLRDRLQLFLRICSGVAYAHKNLIVHSDLKPTNILVTEDGIPKLLDFGIAKLLKPGNVTPALTCIDDRALTPEYSSPEQLSGRPVNTASDIYTLGVLLYELLSGLSPYKYASRAELDEAILITDPVKPSVAITRALSRPKSASFHKVSIAAEERRCTASALPKVLAGDLDAIVMRALRKEPDKRYPSVAAFAADIQRHLDIEPVEARRGNWIYYASRYLRRNAVPVGAAAIVVISLAIFSAATFSMYKTAAKERDNATVERDNAKKERDTAKRITNFMVNVFKNANPFENAGRQVTPVELLNQASNRINDVGNDRGVRAQLLAEMGRAYLSLGRYDMAAQHLKSAADIERSSNYADEKNLATIVINLAKAERGMGDFAAADRSHAEAIRLLSDANSDSAEYAEILRSMGILEHGRGDLKKAESYYHRSLSASYKSGDTPASIAFTMSQLAELYNWANDLTAAEQWGRNAMMLYQSLPATHPDRIRAQFTVADVLYQQQHLDDAATLMDKTVQAQREIYTGVGPELIKSLSLIAKIRDAQGRFKEAESLLTACVIRAERDLGASHYETGFYETAVGHFLIRHQRYVEAVTHLKTALNIFSKSLPQQHQYVASANHWIGEAYLGMHRPNDAVTSLRNALDIWKVTNAPGWLIGRTESSLGEALLAKGSNAEGAQYLKVGYEALNRERGPNDEATRLAFERLRSLATK